MVRHGGETGFRWALALALLLHGAALGAAAHLPAVGLSTDAATETPVFNYAAAIPVTPMTLVDWPAAPLPPTEMRERESAAPIAAVDASKREETTTRAQAQRQPVVRVRPVAQSRRGRRSAFAGPHAPGPSTLPGGGGGGALDLGSPSPNGTLALPSGGGTELGQVPGQGAGTGSGEGSGEGGGSGTGTGGGEGAGAGSGQGDGGTGGTPGPGFVSRLADRAEPEVVRKGRLAYPETAVAEGVEGTCVLKVLVGEKGEVMEAEMTRSSGDRRLDKAALDFVRQWRYRPAVQDGKPRRVQTRATVQFELN